MDGFGERDAGPATQWAFLDAIGDGVYGVDAEGRCVFVNTAALRILGYDRADELLGRNMHAAIHHTRPDGSPFPQAECPLLHTLRSGRPVRLDNETLWRRDGTSFVAEYSSFPVRTGEAVTGSVVTFNDVSLRDEVQRRLAVQHAVSQVLAGNATPEALPGRVLGAVGTGLGWDVGLFWQREQGAHGHEALRCVATWRSRDSGPAADLGHDSEGLLLELGAGLPGHVWVMEAPIHVADLAADASGPRQADAAARGLRSAFAFPIMAGSQVIGAAEFYAQQRIAVDDSLLEAVATLGHQIGQTLERRRVAEALAEAERLKGAILASAPDCIMTADAGGRILEWNAAAERTFNRPADAVLGRDLGATILAPETQAAYAQALARVRDGGAAAQRFEGDALRADGARFPAEFSVTATAGQPHAVFTTHLRDVTARREADLRLRESEARFRTMVNASPQFTWMAAGDGGVVWYNERWYDYTGTTPDEMRGWGWKKVHHPDHVDRVEQRLRRSFASGEPWEDTFPLRGKDGTYNWFLSRALPIRDEPDAAHPEGRITGWLGTNTDITALREAEQHLAAALDEAQAANRAKSTFLANMSHELRTPLSAIIGYSEMLAEEIGDGAASDELAPDIGKIEGNARHLLGLINDVLDLSKVESGKMEAVAETFDVAAAVEEVVAASRALVEKKNRLALHLAEPLGSMHSDPTRVRQILLNLVGNAAKFTEGGTITLSAERQRGADGDWVAFSVADTGIGMTEEELAKVFQRFQQADASTTRKFGGTGLGLALSQAFSTLLGGGIEVRSSPGQGSTFTLRLPASLPEAGGQG